MTKREEVKSKLSTMNDQLQQLRDTIRVKAHLGEKDLTDSLEKLDPQIRDFEHRAELVTETIDAELEANWQQLKTSLTNIRDQLEAAAKRG
jgi:archaellum component FlaC